MQLNPAYVGTPMAIVEPSPIPERSEGSTAHLSTTAVDFSQAEVQETASGIIARPGFKRGDSEQTVTNKVSLAVDNKSQLQIAADPALTGLPDGLPSLVQDGIQIILSQGTFTYPPAELPSVVEELRESKFLRRFRMFAAFFALFLAGWNGGSTGALLPYIEQTYGINYARVSVLFASTFVGYVVAAAGAGTLVRKVGLGHTLAISVIVELMGNVINSSQQASFPLLCFGFFVVGSAFATQLGLCNAYFAMLDKPLLWTGILHGIYGLGAFASPLVATAMLTRGVPYHLFYTTNIGMNVPVFILVWFAFHKLHILPQSPSEDPTVVGSGAFSATLKSRAVWTLAIFLMFYVGAEESIGGWIVSYILEVRHGSPEGASWVASSFYLGIAIGRIALPTLSLFIGERRAVFLYITLAIALECLAWFLPFLASTAVCTALVGLAISTFYAAAITTGGKLIPRSMHADAFALMSSVGQSGSAFWPLIVGVLSTKRGIWVVEPTVVALLGAQGICWWLVPKVERRSE